MRSFILVGIFGITATAIVVCSRAWHGSTQAAADHDTDSLALVVPSSECDFGPVEQEGGTRTHSFSIENRGLDSVGLKLGYKNCACAEVQVPEMVMPGAIAAVKVTIDPARQTGAFASAVEIETTNLRQPSLYFRLTADSVPILQVSPDRLIYASIQGTDRIQQVLTVHSRWNPGTPEPAKPVLSANSSPLQCIHLGRELPERSTNRLDRVIDRYSIKLDPAEWLRSNGAHNGSATLSVSSEASAPVQVAVQISRRHHPFVVGPTSAILHRSRRSERTSLRFWALDGRELAAPRVEVSSPDVVVQVPTKDDPRFVQLNLELSDTAVNSTEDQSIELRVFFGLDDAEPYLLRLRVVP